jgi:hypothetical protein
MGPDLPPAAALSGPVSVEVDHAQQLLALAVGQAARR